MVSAPRPAPAPFNPWWGASRDHPRTATVTRAALSLTLPAIVAAVLVATANPLWGGVVLLLGLALTGAWVAAQGWLALWACAAQPLEPHCHPRLANVLEGLAATLGLEKVSAATAPGSEAQAWLCPIGGGAVLVCSEGLLESFTRTELEAVVASLLVRRRDHKALRPLLAAALGSLASRLGAVSAADDVRTLSVTRYPPALSSALRRARPEQGRAAAFAFAPLGPPSPAQRAAEVLDL